MKFETKAIEKLQYVYPENQDVINQFIQLKNHYAQMNFPKIDQLSEKTIYLITYGDAIYEKDKATLKTLHTFLNTYLKDTISDVHLLPMFEFTSDDGFSVTDYRKIDPKLGDWEDIKELSKDYKLMFDFVANHISKSSSWFQSYLRGEEKYQHYFVEYDENFDYTNVTRPRVSPLFHDYQGNKKVWTTFSEDQVDLNFANPDVFIEMSKVLLEYVVQGASSIRLDAIGFIWKESKTTCMHHQKAHAIITLWRLLLDEIKPNCQIITETNVPHIENISYFGENNDEANMVYQFALPPLVLHSFVSEDASVLSDWASTIDNVGNACTYFNFLSSHDGIGLRASEGILNDEQRQNLVDRVIKNGGKVSYKNNPDHTQSVYEMNINYHDALLSKDDSLEIKINKIKAANAILCSVVGVPALYYHSLLGSRNDIKGCEDSGINRRINREKFELYSIINDLELDDRKKAIYKQLQTLLKFRQKISAFHPFAQQRIMQIHPQLFAVTRYNKETNDCVTSIVNVSSQTICADVEITGIDLLTNTVITSKVTLKPYEFMWIRHDA